MDRPRTRAKFTALNLFCLLFVCTGTSSHTAAVAGVSETQLAAKVRICFQENHYVFVSVIRTFLRQIEKHLADRFSGDAVQRAATPAGDKRPATAAAAAAASSAAPVSSPLQRIQEDEEELSSPDVAAKLEVGARAAFRRAQNCVFIVSLPMRNSRSLPLPSPPSSSPCHLISPAGGAARVGRGARAPRAYGGAAPGDSKPIISSDSKPIISIALGARAARLVAHAHCHDVLQFKRHLSDGVFVDVPGVMGSNACVLFLMFVLGRN